DRRHLWRVNVVDGEPKAITAGNGIQWSPTVTGDAKYLAMLASTDKIPGFFFVKKVDDFLLADKPWDVILPPAIDPTILGTHELNPTTLNRIDDGSNIDFLSHTAFKLVTPQQVIFKAADGLEIHGQLFLPKDAKPTDKLPAVIFSHGGPSRQMMLGWHNMYYYHNAYGFNQYLASKGYAVLSVNYRLGISYGRAFRQAKNGGGRGASEYQDIVAAAQYLRSRSDIDQSRIGLWGGSYGGYLTALGLARNSDLFAAGVDLHGV